MSLNISDKTVSLIVQNYLGSLVLITKTFIGDTTISDLKKRKFETWRVDYSGLEIKTILFEWTKQFTWIFCFYGWQENVVFFEQNKKVVIRWSQQQYGTENSVIFLAYFIPI